MNARKVSWAVRSASLALGVLLVAGCGEPSPARVEITSRSDSFTTPELEADPTIVQGDLLVLEAQGYDDSDDPMDVCAEATSSDPSVAEVRKVRDACRLFAVLAREPGKATVTLSVRGTLATVVLEVAPSRP